jgi:hypothetical protein
MEEQNEQTNDGQHQYNNKQVDDMNTSNISTGSNTSISSGCFFPDLDHSVKLIQ